MNSNMLSKSVLVLVLAGGFSSLAAAQTIEQEPNDTCPTAQLVQSSLPLTIHGSLDSTFDFRDLDYFLVSANPGSFLQVDMVPAGAQPVADPFLGVFRSDCLYIGVNDNGGDGFNARLRFTVPEDGLFVIAATVCCDWGFYGGGLGSYQLLVGEAESIEAVTGQAIDARTRAPLNSEFPQYARAWLLGCGEFGCDDFLAITNLDQQGFFEISETYYGEPLPPGMYRVLVQANGYNERYTDPFEVGANERLDLGQIEVDPLRYLSSISGRLVDSVDGRPVAGDSPFYAFAQLIWCEQDQCYTPIAWATADDQGRFTFSGRLFNLLEGYYQVVAFAQQYESVESERFFVAEAEDFDLGTLRITPLPFQFTLVESCYGLPTQGGTCRSILELRNASERRLSGASWMTVDIWPLGPNYTRTQFQAGKQGTTNPMPVPFNLQPGAQRRVLFQFDVPGSVNDGAIVCPVAWAGLDPSPIFNVQVAQASICFIKGSTGWRTLSDKEARRLLHER